MKRNLLWAVLLLAMPGVGHSYDRAHLLLSDHTVICSPGTPTETVRHLVETWGAMICVVQSDALGSRPDLLPWVAVQLPSWSDEKSAKDSLYAWRERLNLTTAVVCDDSALEASATAAGLRVFTQKTTFQKGDVAVPAGGRYFYYHGSAPAFFNRESYLEQLTFDSLKSKGNAAWQGLGSGIAAAFQSESDTSVSRWETLLRATHTADSISHTTSDPRTRFYADRWRYCMAWWLSPIWTPDTLVFFAGQETSDSIQVRASEATISLAGIRVDAGRDSVAWNTSFPVDLSPALPTTLSGRFAPTGAGRMNWPCDLECRFGTFRFNRRIMLPVVVQTALQADLLPPVLLMDGEFTRDDPDFAVKAISGQLELCNRTPAPLNLRLVWRADAPIEISSISHEITLASGERKKTGFTLSVPKDLPYKEYGFAADISTASGPLSTVQGQVWKDSPKRTGAGPLGVLGFSSTFLQALPSFGMQVTALSAGTIRAAQWKPLSAVIICGGVAAPTPAEQSAIQDFVESGGVAILEMERSALAWLPWPVNVVTRPGPFASSFYNEDLDWWQSPNTLVGGCFAASNKDAVLTLAPGETGWEPLVVDDSGKGFMYRYRQGSGWFVVVHSGWFPRLEHLERRAHQGLFNLVSAASR